MAISIGMGLEKAIESFRDCHKRNLEWSRKRHRDELTRTKARWRLVQKLIAVLPQEAELKLDTRYDWEAMVVRFPQEALVKMRAAVGRLQIAYKELSDPEATPPLLTIRLTAEKYPGINFEYTRPLPEGASCKVVTQTSTFKTLVCTRE